MEQVLNYQQHFNLMKFIKNFILILLFIFPISNSFGAMTFNQKAEVHNYDTNKLTLWSVNKQRGHCVYTNHGSHG
jgi:hypothetical protein